MSKVDSSDQGPRRAKWTISLGGGVMDDITYGVVEFARGKPVVRASVFIVALALTAFLILIFTGVIKGYPAASAIVAPAFFFVIPAIFRMALWSSDDFSVGYKVSEAQSIKEKAERRYDESKSAEDAVSLDEARLNSYYEINQAQAKASFRWAVGMMVVGFSTIIVGVWLFYLRDSRADVLMTGLTTAAGMVSNLVSVMFLSLHHKTQDRSDRYYAELAEARKTQVAMKLAVTKLEGDDQVQALRMIIDGLMRQQFASPMKSFEPGELS